MAKSKTKAKKATKSNIVAVPTKVPVGVPTGVKVIAVLEYIFAAILLLLALLFFVASAFVEEVLQSAGVDALPSGAGATIAIGIGVLFLGIAVLSFFIGRGLWNGRNWARILAIVFSAIWAILDVMSVANGQFSSIITLAVNALIGGYLLFSEEVKAAFA